jgi:protocatechuate 3,4-dioxygenase beta subunit
VRGTVVHAAADGEVASIFAESRTEAGKVVAIIHGGGLKSFYMHLDEIRPGLEVGQTIHAGEPVGLLGSTGFKRSIPHVHFAITHEWGRTWYLDPEPILRHAVVLAQPRAYDPFEPTTHEPLTGKPVIRRITTDGKGAFHIDGVAPGSYVAGAFASDFAPGASSTFAVTGAQDTAGVQITLDAGIAVKGVVVGPNGAVPDAVVMAGAGIGETAHKIATTRTDKNGRFILRALAGKVTIAVQVPGYGEQERALVVDERTKEQTFQLVIENARLRGQVLAPDGGAAAGVAVRVIDGVSRRRGITDAQGRFTIEHVATGNYTVELSGPDYPAKRVELVTEQWREVRLENGGALRVLVRDAQSNTPLAGTRVEVGGVARTTDASGVVELRGLLAGEHAVSAKKAGYTPASQTTVVRAERVAKEIQLALARGATISGTIRDRYGRRVAGARVTIGSASTKTDPEGNFRLADAPSGTGVVEAELEGAKGTLAVELAPGAERSGLTIELQ